MTNQPKKQPVETIRLGALKAAIWANQGENGTFFSFQMERTYTDGEGNFQSTSSFSGRYDALVLQRLLGQVFDRMETLRQHTRKVGAPTSPPREDDAAVSEDGIPF